MKLIKLAECLICSCGIQYVVYSFPGIRIVREDLKECILDMEE